jgi:hypothetical protein
MEAIFVGQIFDLDVLGKRFALSLELLDLVAAVQAILGSVQLALDIVLSPRRSGLRRTERSAGLFLPSDFTCCLIGADVQHQGEADLFPGKGGELWASLWQEA